MTHVSPRRPLPDEEAMMNKIYATVDDTVRARKRRNTWIGVAAGITVLAAAGGVALMLNRPPAPPVAGPPQTVVPVPTGTSTPSGTMTPAPPQTIPPAQPKWKQATITLDLGGVLKINDEDAARDPDRGEAWLVTQLGEPDQRVESAICTRPGETESFARKNTVLRWGDLRLTIVNEVLPGPGADFPAGGVMGWQVDPSWDGEQGASPDARLANGIGIGSTPVDLKAAWPDQPTPSDFFSVFVGDISDFNARLVDGKVSEMYAGYACDLTR